MTRRCFLAALIALVTACSLSGEPQQVKPADQTAAKPARDNPFDKFPEFSATRSGGLMNAPPVKMYRSGKLMRFDYPDHYRIADMQARSLWVVYPNRCSRLPALDLGVFPFSRRFHVETSTTVGKETIDGHPCNIADVVLVGEETVPSKFRMKLYQAEDLRDFPLKIESENLLNSAKYEIRYSNVSLEKPDPKLFEHPAHCDQSNIPAPLSKEKPNPASGKKASPKPAPKPQ